MGLLNKPNLGKGLKLPSIVGAKTNTMSTTKPNDIAALVGAPKPIPSGAPAAPSTAIGGTPIKSPMKVGTGGSAVKTPKAKGMPDATDKPSLFFKNEDFSSAKHPSVQKLRDFLNKSKSRKQSSS